MRILAIDFGTKKCGIAISDPLQIISQPLKIIFYNSGDFEYLIKQIKLILDEYKPFEAIVMGITKNIDNSLSHTAKITMKFKEKLEKETSLNVHLIDEKYTSQESKDIMNEMNLNLKAKKKRKDAIAAQKILENYLLYKK